MYWLINNKIAILSYWNSVIKYNTNTTYTASKMKHHIHFITAMNTYLRIHQYQKVQHLHTQRHLKIDMIIGKIIYNSDKSVLRGLAHCYTRFNYVHCRIKNVQFPYPPSFCTVLDVQSVQDFSDPSIFNACCYLKCAVVWPRFSNPNHQRPIKAWLQSTIITMSPLAKYRLSLPFCTLSPLSKSTFTSQLLVLGIWIPVSGLSRRGKGGGGEQK